MMRWTPSACHHEPVTGPNAPGVGPRLPSAARVEAFSDGVLAIAITLLVLDLHVPTGRGEFVGELGREWQSYLAYLASFLIIGTLWLTHHALFVRIAQVDGPLLQANLALLLFASVLPFPTSIISAAFRGGDHEDEVVAMLLFAAVSIALSVTWHLLSGHVARTPVLLHRRSDAAAVRRDRRRQLLGVAPPLAGAALSFATPIGALLLQAVTPLVYLASTAAAPPEDDA